MPNSLCIVGYTWWLESATAMWQMGLHQWIVSISWKYAQPISVTPSSDLYHLTFRAHFNHIEAVICPTPFLIETKTFINVF